MIRLKFIVPTVLLFAMISTFTVVRSDKQRKEEEANEIPSRIEEINLDDAINLVEDHEYNIDLEPKQR